MSKTIRPFNTQEECHHLEFDNTLIRIVVLEEARSSRGLFQERSGAAVQLLPGRGP
jgi:hypothetical protein